MLDFLTQPANSRNLRTIKTAKTLEEINQAAREGYRPLIRKVVPSDEIKQQLCLVQHRQTGEVARVTDRRTDIGDAYGGDWEVVLPFFTYYPQTFPNPYAAYLIPEDIEPDEIVFIEELIEDIRTASFQGNGIRLRSAEAYWNGQDLVIVEGQTFEQNSKKFGNRKCGNKLLG